MDSDYAPLNDMDDNSYTSLFPGLDKFILYTPSYILKDRPHIIHRIIAVSFAVGIMSTQIIMLLVFIGTSTYGMDYETFGFIILMIFLPLLASGLRLYFFIYNFKFDIWHRPKNALSNPSKYESSLSFLLKQEPYLLARMCERFKIGCWILSILIGLMTIFHLFINFQYAMPHLFNENETEINLNGGSFAYPILFIIVQTIGQQIPDCLMMIVGRLYFTECHLAILDYTKKLKMMSTKDIMEKNIYIKYLEMYEFIESMSKHFKHFILCFIITFCWLCWYILAIFGSHISHIYNGTSLSIQNAALLVLYALQYAVSGIFTLWPAFRMTELFDELVQVVDDKINHILENRIHLYDEGILKSLMESFKHNKVKTCNSDDIAVEYKADMLQLKSNIEQWSEQRSALEILTKLVSTMEERSCAYQVFGLSLDRYSIRNFVIGLFVGKILSVMWSSV